MRKLAILFLVLAVGCLTPPRTEFTTSGQKLRPEQYRFLDDPRADRAEVLATLGPPNFIALDERVFLYAWELQTVVKSDEVFVIPFPLVVVGKLGEHDWGETVRRKGLFIEFDPNGKICRHEVGLIPEQINFEEACRLWLERTNQSAVK